MPKHCPTCNRTSDEARFYGEFCEFCTRDKLSARIRSEIPIHKCKRCKRIRVGERFMAESKQNMQDSIQKHFKDKEIKLIDYKPKSAQLSITERLRDGDITFEKAVALKHVNEMCQTCYRKASGYYEAVVQLRDNPTRAQSFINRLSRFLDRDDEFIAKIVEVSNGVDVYTSNKKLTAEFISMEGWQPTISYTLYGLKGGRKVYRNTYAIRL